MIEARDALAILRGLSDHMKKKKKEVDRKDQEMWEDKLRFELEEAKKEEAELK